MATINGDNRPNTLNGTPQSDIIRGFGGGDRLNGLGDADYLFGGNGNDRLRGGAGSDTLNGGAGNIDILQGENGNDRLFGGDGFDRLLGGGGVDTLFGGAGADHLVGGTEAGVNDFAGDRMFGGAGDDFFDPADASSDQLLGEDGDDTFYFVNNDAAMGGPGDDSFRVFEAGGRLTGGAGNDTFANETRTGGGGQQVLVTDFTTADRFGWSASGDDFFYLQEVVFDFFDSNDDGMISASDRSSTSTEGVSFAVRDTGRDLVLAIEEDTVTFNNVGAINGADWA